MLSDAALTAAERAATELRLGELIAIQPRHLRGGLAPGQRMPGGARPGKGRAQSLDFDGISPYAPGDDVRAIEWKSTLRTGVPQMRRYAAESHRARMIVLDLRPDLYFGASERLMAKSAVLISAWLAWESRALQEPVGLTIPGAAQIAPRRGRRQVLTLLQALVAAYQAPSETASPLPFLEEASQSLGRGDEICFVSDAPVAPEGLVACARRLSARQRMRFYLVEDPAIAGGAPPGRYPSRGPDGRRQAPLIHKARVDEDPARRALRDAGWDVIPALDILPRGVATP